MLQNALKKFFGDRNQRLLNKMGKIVAQISALEPQLQRLNDAQLAGKTAEFRQRATAGESTDNLLVEAFAVVREASVRTLGLRHFDVQLIGGMVLNQGKIAEMKTGEGKTLVATLPSYLNAVCGKPVHVVTVNDYLANRDAQWMGKIYDFLQLKVGVIQSGQSPQEKRAAYLSDIVYGTNNEFGFDYLRDNMAFSGDDRCQKGLGFAVIDEVDSILIDEARTPLIISGPAEDSTDLYPKINVIVPKLQRQIDADGADDEDGENSTGDFSVDEKARQVSLTEQGYDHAETFLIDAGLLEQGGSLYEVASIGLLHHLYAALRAHNLFHKDVDYIVRDDAIIIIDEFTGRMMPGRRWSEGLHQAIEAKEGATIQQENQTLASITFQNYFRLYENLAGMTGTADTEAPEFLQIYALEVVIMPPNRDMVRTDYSDLVYRTTEEKFTAICMAIQECTQRSQPVLVGTASIESSEMLAGFLTKEGIEHQVLNAKQHGREAQIIAEAGRPSSVTIATNMAGRGTDIVLGGNIELELSQIEDEGMRETAKQQWQQRHDQVLNSGGLHVLGTERNESRRVDNQLRGRCGRQGDPGSSKFYLSLEDSLMRIFGSQKIAGLMEKLGMEDGEAIEHPWVTKAIENAQKKVEGHNFDMRKQLLEYDDVANEQRKVVYEQRNELMESDDVSDYIEFTRAEVINNVIDRSISPQTLEEQWNIAQLEADLQSEFGVTLTVKRWLEQDDSLHEETLRRKILASIKTTHKIKEMRVGPASMRHFEKQVMLKVLDEQWKEHLANMDYLRQGIGLRGYAQKNPKQEYKREAFEMFGSLMDSVKAEVISILAKVHVPSAEEMAEMESKLRQQQAQAESRKFVHEQAESAVAAEIENESGKQSNKNAAAAAGLTTFVRSGKKIGRNDLCPCDSGKKYKQCHGKI